MARCRLGLYEKALPEAYSFEAKFAAAKEAGFDFLELSVDETEEKLARLRSDRAFRNRLRRLTEEYELPVYTMCLSGHRKFPLGSADPAKAKRALEISKGAAELAADLGIRIIQLAGYDVYYEPSTEDTRRRFEENLRKSVEIAASHGVILAFETMETPFMNTVEKALAWVEKIDSPYLQIYPDVGNVFNGASDPAADLRRGAGHLAAAHLKETREGVFRNLMYGEGRVDFPAAAAALRESGVRLFTAEFWHREGTDPRKNLKRAFEFLRPLLD